MKPKRPYNRTDRVANEILSILGQIQMQHIDLSELGFITFSHVSISTDLKYAKVFFSVVQNKLPINKVEDALNSKAKAFRKYLGRMIRIKFTPDLKFYFDDTFSYTEKIENIFQNIDSKD
ncbi:MAG: 30S ribosome-binding factor RbfA [Candidatus Neomarinimicrobiota bacterium]|nr:30S ribosome-binding factor RbfA [Candidatus Neomarinimicrobiota bacterium]